MKIAFIVLQFPVLSETFVLNQATGLIDRGHEVDIYACSPTPADTSKVHPDVEKYRLLARTYHVPSYSPTMPSNRLLRALKGLWLFTTNFHQAPLALMRSLNIFRYGRQAASLWLLYKAIPFLKNRNYDIIHCQFGTLGIAVLPLLRLGILKGRLVVSFRGYDISQYLKMHGDDVYQELLQVGSLFLTNCEFFKRRLLSLGCSEQKIVVHRSGLDCSRFHFAPRHPPRDGRIRIVTTGRLVEKKGIEYGIRAVAKLAPLYPNLQYAIIGDGPLRQDFETLIAALNIGHLVQLLGWKEQLEIIEILDSAQIFMAPSVTAMDGNQDAPVNTLKEAMAMGLPVIATQHGGIPELVEEGISGFLVPERDAEAIADKLDYLIQHPQLWPQMGRAGRACVEQDYSLNKLNDQLVELYEQAIAEGQAMQPHPNLVTFVSP
jgi:colanic acid/amylovoran biosynthesis glycosyltransferase